MKSAMKVGIDAISFAVPKLFLPIDGPWAEKRADVFSQGNTSELISKVTNGIGISRMAIPDLHEDVVTLAANALRKLLEQNSISLGQVSHILFASEGGVDLSKAASSYVLGLLADYFKQDISHIANIEMKFACAASSYAIEYAQALVRAKITDRKYILVVASDIARYELETPAEYTQGAGAVALAICEDPRILELDTAVMTTASADERDFFRPLFRDTPTVDGKYSVEVYLNLVEKAFAKYSSQYFEKKLNASFRDILGETAALLFHVPFPKMAEYIAGRILFPHFHSTELLTPDARAEAEKTFRKSDIFRGIVADKIEPSLTLSREIGNIYSASLPLGLVSFLSQPAEKLSAIAGKRAIFFAYGSGATARVYSGSFTKEIAHNCKNLISLRRGEYPVSVDDYERLHSHQEVRKENGTQATVIPLGISVQKPKDEFVYLGMKAEPITELGLRMYRYQS